jgi:hypothetical protein
VRLYIRDKVDIQRLDKQSSGFSQSVSEEGDERLDSGHRLKIT